MMNTAIEFLIESEKLKGIERRTSPVNLERRENSAEHSWSLALAAMVLIPLIEPSLDTLRVLKMLLIHDMVEIDAGDTFCYADQTGKLEKEKAAADRIFGILPESLHEEHSALWGEFEECVSREALFANALDRLFPLLQNYNNEGGSWLEHGVTFDQAYRRNLRIKDGSEELWQYAQKIMNLASSQGWLPKQKES